MADIAQRFSICFWRLFRGNYLAQYHAFFHQRESLEQVLNSDFPTLFAGSSYTVLLFAAWAGLYFGLSFYFQKQQQQKNALILSEQAKAAQLQSLRYQLNPHFLFNVLNSIDVAVQEHDNDVAHNMLVKLSRLLRVTLEADEPQKVTLSEEVALLEDFVAIEKERYVETIEFEKQLADNTFDLLVPSLILQPLMENAIKYTWQAKENKKILLRTYIEGPQLCIALSNPYLTNGQQRPAGTNTGISNVQNRINALYKHQAGVTFEQQDGIFNVVIKLPKESVGI